MTVIQKTAVVPHTPRQMFELVNSIEEYPRFLPWCKSSEVLSRTDKEVVARLDIAWSGIHKSFTTKNTLHPYEAVEINLVEGPFQHLEGRWSFIPLDVHGCKIHVDLEFEFRAHFFEKLFEPIFKNIANNLVTAFCKRANEIYAKK